MPCGLWDGLALPLPRRSQIAIAREQARRFRKSQRQRRRAARR